MIQPFPRKLKMLVIDWDGTLVSAEKMVHAAYLQTFKSLKNNKIWTIEDTRAKNGEDPNVIFKDQALWGDKGAEARSFFYAHYNKLTKRRPDLLQLKEGATEFLEFLKVSYPTVKRVLLAAKTQSILEAEAEEFGLTDSFNAIVGKTDDGPNKPDKEVFNRAAAAVGLTVVDPRQEVMHIGDNIQKDEAFAQSYGAMSVIVNEKSTFKCLNQLRDELSNVQILTAPLFKNGNNPISSSGRIKS